MQTLKIKKYSNQNWKKCNRLNSKLDIVEKWISKLEGNLKNIVQKNKIIF